MYDNPIESLEICNQSKKNSGSGIWTLGDRRCIQIKIYIGSTDSFKLPKYNLPKVGWHWGLFGMVAKLAQSKKELASGGGKQGTKAILTSEMILVW